MNQHVQSDQIFFLHAEEIATAATAITLGWRSFATASLKSRGLTLEGFHASTPRILSRVIGKSLTRFPIAL